MGRYRKTLALGSCKDFHRYSCRGILPIAIEEFLFASESVRVFFGQGAGGILATLIHLAIDLSPFREMRF